MCESGILEIKEIMDLLGRGYQDGYIRGTHLAQILMYLRETKTEKMKKTLSKLALVCAMTPRSLRESYLEGLEAFGIIDVKVISHDVVWNWNGKKSLDNGSMKIPELDITESATEYMKEQQKKKGDK